MYYCIDTWVTDPQCENHSFLGCLGATLFGVVIAVVFGAAMLFPISQIVAGIGIAILGGLGIVKGVIDIINGYGLYGSLEILLGIYSMYTGIGIALIGKASINTAQTNNKNNTGAKQESPTSNTSSTETNFYVKPNGEVIPSTGYRYISKDAPYLESINSSMYYEPNTEGTYFSYNCYDVANPGALQVPHDASIRLEFNTLQIIDDISVPNSEWGLGKSLEPITYSYPEYGPGGATQVITHSGFIIDKITKLPF